MTTSTFPPQKSNQIVEYETTIKQLQEVRKSAAEELEKNGSICFNRSTRRRSIEERNVCSIINFRKINEYFSITGPTNRKRFIRTSRKNNTRTYRIER